MMSVGLVVNSYERTYRDVLSPGFFPGIEESNQHMLSEKVALINNVDDRLDAKRRAEALVSRGEITSYAFVSDHLDAALRATHLPRRSLRWRPYLIDYGLVMPHVVSTDWLLGWDAETRLSQPADWITPSIELMLRDPRVFHASVNWPPARQEDPGLEGDVIAWDGDFALSWGFSDQLFLARRSDLLRPIYRTLCPAAVARHAPHPYTFEYRIESYQRTAGHLRATLSTVSYRTNSDLAGVLVRHGETPWERLRLKALRKIELRLLNRLPASMGPRFVKRAGIEFAKPGTER